MLHSNPTRSPYEDGTKPVTVHLDRGLVVHPAWSYRAGPKGPAWAVADGGGLDRVLLALPGDECPPPDPVGPWPPDLGLGAVDAELDPAAGGVGEHVGQGVQPHAGRVGDGEAALGQQRSDLMDGAGDGGAVNPVQHRQRLVWELEAQVDQGDQDPVTNHQPVGGAGPGGAPPGVAATLVEVALVGGGPRGGQLSGQLGEMLPRQPGKDRMGEGRTGPCWFSPGLDTHA